MGLIALFVAFISHYKNFDSWKMACTVLIYFMHKNTDGRIRGSKMSQVRTLDVGQIKTKMMDLNLVSWVLLSSVPSKVWLTLKIGVLIN